MSEFWLDEEDEKFHVEFSIRGFGKTQKFYGDYEDCVPWRDILHDVVKTLEASYGYSFDLDVETEYGTIGIYQPGKDNE